MEEEIYKTIVDMSFEGFKDKIVIGESIEDYFNKITKVDIEMILYLYYLIKKDDDLLTELVILKGRQKKVGVSYIVEKYKDIYGEILKYLDEDIIFQLKQFIKQSKDGYLKVNVYNHNYSIDFFLTLKRVNIINAKYNKKNGELEVCIQKDILDMIKRSLNDKSLMRECKKNSDIYVAIFNILNLYGCLPLSILNDIIKKEYTDIDCSKVYDNICIKSVIGAEINIFEDEDDFLVASHNFEDEDDAFMFYYSLDENIDYKRFSRKDIDDFGNDIYHHKFKQFDKLKKFILNTFDMNDEDFKIFDIDLIVDYIYSFQDNPDVAKSNLNMNLDKFFEGLDKKDKLYIMKAISDIAMLCPAYHLKGNAVDEEKIKDSLIS